MERHMIYTNGRSGSNALTVQLRQHPNLENYGEVLGPWTTPGKYLRPLFRGPDSGTRYLNFILGSRPAFTTVQTLSHLVRKRSGRPSRYRRWSDIHSLGVKEFAVNFQRNGMDDYFQNNADLRLVVLLRENPVERYVSYQRLRQTGVVGAKAAAPVKTQRAITIPAEQVLADLDRIQGENDLLTRAAAEHQGPTLMLKYEEIYSLDEAGQEQVSTDVQEFLGVTPMKLTRKTRQLRPANMADSIENYAEFREVIAPTDYARWLTD